MRCGTVKKYNMAIIILLVALGLLIQFGLIYGAIMLATEKERKLIKIQTAILSKIAKAKGINANEIDELYIGERLKILL